MSPRLVVQLAALVAIAAAGFLAWSFAAAPYVFRSQAMLPSLMVDDTLLVDKWRFGSAGWPFGVAGRAAYLPERGDILVFRASREGQAEVKRLIGLPGDRIAMKQGIVVLNGKSIPRWRIADFVVAASPNSPCQVMADGRLEVGSDHERLCRYPRYREMLPGGRTYSVLGGGGDRADMPETKVPTGTLFVIGDNREHLAESDASTSHGREGRLVPLGSLIGRANTILFSTDGSWRWAAPSTWRGALRRDRIAKTL